jgi:hypothetical protein
MRTYRKVWINEDLDTVTAHETESNATAIALSAPVSKNQMILKFNRLGGRFAGKGAIWKLYDVDGNLIVTFSGPQLASDTFSWVAYPFHAEN